MSSLRGVYAAAVTPCGNDGSVDFGAAFELIDHCSRGGVAGILLLGEQGEYTAFAPDERSRLAYLAAKRSRIPILAGVGSPTFEQSVTLGRAASEAGAAAVLLPPPCFFRYGPDDLADYYVQFSRQMYPGTPVLLYNTPRTTGGIPIEAMMRLLETGLFAGAVDAAADQKSFSCFKAAAQSGRLEILIESDALFEEARMAGCGVVSPLACALPELAAALHQAVGRGNAGEVTRLRHLAQEFLDRSAALPDGVALKTALQLRGLKTGPHAIPLSPARQKQLGDFREWLCGWLPGIRKLSANA